MGATKMADCCDDQLCAENYETLLEYNERLVLYAHALAKALAAARDERNALSEAI